MTEEFKTKTCSRCHVEQSLRRFRWLKRHNRGREEIHRDSWCHHSRTDYKKSARQKGLAAERQRLKRLNDPVFREQQRLKAAAYYAQHREQISAAAKRKRGQIGHGIEVNLAWLNSRLRTKYGLSVEAYQQLSAAQNHRCAICRCEETSRMRSKIRRLVVDHDHVTNRVLGLLCHHCNTGLGNFKDDPVLLMKAINYIRRNARHRRKPNYTVTDYACA